MTTTSVLELDEVIRRHAWSVLCKRSNAFRRFFLEEKDYYCDVDWSCLSLDHHVSKFEVRPEGRTYPTEWGSIRTGQKWVPLYACDFDNRSETKQNHTFRGSRETTTWISVDLSQTYTIANGVDVEVNVPSHSVLYRAGRDTGFKVTKVKGNVFKEVLEWEVNSQVEVMPSWKAHAQLLAREESQMVDFEVRTTLSLPLGVLPVRFKKRSDNSTAHEVKIDKLEEVFQTKEEGGTLEEEEMQVVHNLMETLIDAEGNSRSDSKLQLITLGTCVCVAWSDQKVDIKTSQLSISDQDDGDVGTPARHTSTYPPSQEQDGKVQQQQQQEKHIKDMLVQV
ncbi:uncharacterized protein LOC143298526 [Babylonia areolata]|uniref:uncharacterized protein LOC143298526 n=1 Tax=Babylonia areolata TaxID=304850 RepID=UPI003FD543F6